MNAKESESRSNAKRRMQAIESLRGNKNYAGYLVARYQEKLVGLEKRILDQDKLTVEEIAEARIQRKFLMNEIMRMPDNDYASARKVLGIESAGETTD